MALIWSFGSTPLLTYAYRITLVNDYLDMPERRGENTMIPFRHGTSFVKKYYSERKMTFGMAIRAASAAALETTMDDMRAKFAVNTEQVLSCTREDASVRTALASVNSPMQVERHGSKTALVVVDFVLSFPFFRLSTEVASNEVTVNASPKAWSVINPGTAPEVQPVLVLTGPLSSPVITNSNNGFILTYAGVIASPRVVTLSMVNNEWVATTDLGVDVIANFSHSGGAGYMQFEPNATNILSITDGTATTGKVRARFNAPFM